MCVFIELFAINTAVLLPRLARVRPVTQLKHASRSLFEIYIRAHVMRSASAFFFAYVDRRARPAATWRSPARSLASAGDWHCLPLHSQASDLCICAVPGSHFLRFARCLAAVLLLTAPTQQRRRPPSRCAALPTAASRGSATIQQ